VIDRIKQEDNVKDSRDIGGFYGWICEINIPLEIGIYHVSDTMIRMILMEEKEFVGSLTLRMYRPRKAERDR
jgi:hypothetical protein